MEIIESIGTVGGLAFAAKKVLGPTLDKVGGDFATLYTKGRDLIVQKTFNKIEDPNDGQQANLRVAREVFWNGSFSDEAISAEYFGGILASSRSIDGKNDNDLYFVNIVKMLSSEELYLHYIIYNAFNKYFVDKKIRVNVGLESDVTNRVLYFDTLKLCEITGIDFSKISTHLNILYGEKLIGRYSYGPEIEETEVGNKMRAHFSVAPTTMGVTLYAVSHNRFSDWSQFDQKPFGDFSDIKIPKKVYEKKEDIPFHLLTPPNA